VSEPFPMDPRLRALCQQAAQQNPTPTRVAVDDIRRIVATRDRAWTIRTTLAAAACLGACALGFASWRASQTSDPAPMVLASEQDPPPRREASTDPTPHAPSIPPNVHAPIAAAALRLDSAATIERLGDSDTPEVLDPWHAVLVTGEYHVRVAASAKHPLTLVTTREAVRLLPGTETWVTVDSEGRLRSQAWSPNVHGPRPSAADLSRQAEEALQRRDTHAALTLLRRLATAYPRAPEARTGLLDLARLEASNGDPRRAVCAFRLYLERWPAASVRPEVERALAGLPQKVTCRSLKPRG